MKGNSRAWQLIDLPLSDYREVLNIQETLLAKVAAGREETSLILVEHFPVFTMGNSADPENIKVAQSFLHSQGIECVLTRRGGDITYHGPGQLIAYPIISLRKHALSVPDYVHLLEEVMVQTAASFGVTAHRRAANRGVWCGDKKLGSVGIALKRWTSYHGLALNIDMDMTPFGWINPCGLKNVSVTSLALETGSKISLGKARTALRHAFTKLFGIELYSTQHHEPSLFETGKQPTTEAALA